MWDMPGVFGLEKIAGGVFAIACVSLLLSAAHGESFYAAFAADAASCPGPSFSCPQVAFLNSSGEVKAAVLGNLGSRILFISGAQSPSSETMAVAAEGEGGAIGAYVCAGGCNEGYNWVYTDAGRTEAATATGRNFALAFDYYGNLHLVYAAPGTGGLVHLALPAGKTSFADAARSSVPDSQGSGNFSWVEISASGKGGGIVLLSMQKSGSVAAWIWDGASWSPAHSVTGGASSTRGYEAIAAAYSGDGASALAVSGTGDEGGLAYSFWNGNAWSDGQFDIDPMDLASARWVSLHPRPDGAGFMAVVVDSMADLTAAYWDGTSWAYRSQLDSDVDTANAMPAGFAWGDSGSYGLLAWETDITGSAVNFARCSPQCVPYLSSGGAAGKGMRLGVAGISGGAAVLSRLDASGTFSVLGAVPGASAATLLSVDHSSYSNYTLARPYAVFSGGGFACTEVSSPGIYTLGQPGYGAPISVPGAGGAKACIAVSSSDVVVDCGGNALRGGANDSGAYGVFIGASARNVTIRGCAVSGYGTGIYAGYAKNAIIEGGSISSCGTGAVFADSYGMGISGTSFNSNSRGISVSSGYSSWIASLQGVRMGGAMLSLSDNVSPGEDYSVSDSPGLASSPPGTYLPSAANVLVSGSGTLDSLSLSDPAGNAAESELWRYSGGFALMNNTPSGDYISASDAPAGSVYSIFYPSSGGNSSGNLTNGTAVADSSLAAWHSGASGTTYAGAAAGFFANFTSSGAAIAGANCTISFGAGQQAMAWNASSSIYSYYRTFDSAGTYLWSASCGMDGYAAASAYGETGVLAAPIEPAPTVQYTSKSEPDRLSALRDYAYIQISYSAASPLDRAVLGWNGSLFSMACNATSCAYNATGLAPGTYSYGVTLNTTSGMSASAPVRTISLNDAPQVSIITPNDESAAGWTVLVRAEASDSSLDSVWFEVRNGSSSAPAIYSSPMVLAYNGQYEGRFSTGASWPFSGAGANNLTLMLYANDTMGALSETSSRFALDNALPGMQYVSPTRKGKFFNSDFTLEIYLSSDSLDRGWYAIAGPNGSTGSGIYYNGSAQIRGAGNHTFRTGIDVDPMQDGRYNLTAYALDSRHSVTRATYFYVDKSPPQVDWLDGSVGNGASIGNYTATISFSCTDAFRDSAWLVIDGVRRGVSQQGENYSLAIRPDGLSDTVHYYSAWCNDSSGKVTSTSNRSLSKDSLPAEIWYSEQGMNESALLGMNSMYLEISYTKNLSSAALEIGNATHKMNCADGTCTVNVTCIHPGNYTYRVAINDSFGNTAYSPWREVSVQFSSCQELCGGGRYVQGSDISGDTIGGCMRIVSSDTVYDCAGHYVAGYGYGFALTITNRSLSNITIRNCNFQNFSSGLLLSKVSGVSLENTSITGNTGPAITIQGSSGVRIDPSYFCNSSGDGILINASDNAQIVDSVVCNNSGHGVHIVNSFNVTVSNMSIFGNGLSGIYAENSSNGTYSINYVYNNSAGIDVVSGEYNLLQGNDISNNTGTGVLFMGNSSHSTLSSNTICGNGLDIGNYGSFGSGTGSVCGSFANWSENGHAGCSKACESIWHYFIGNATGGLDLMSASSQGKVIYSWSWAGATGKIYAVNSHKGVSWATLVPIGRTIGGNPSYGDFEDMDAAMNLTGSPGGDINTSYSINGSAPLKTMDMALWGIPMQGVPVRNNTDYPGQVFYTGVLWDSAYDNSFNSEYDTADREPLVFVSQVLPGTQAHWGTYDYEMAIPYKFAEYYNTSDTIYFYMEFE
jgi:parallel beta-helix repeat protein